MVQKIFQNLINQPKSEIIIDVEERGSAECPMFRYLGKKQLPIRTLFTFIL